MKFYLKFSLGKQIYIYVSTSPLTVEYVVPTGVPTFVRTLREKEPYTSTHRCLENLSEPDPDNVNLSESSSSITPLLLPLVPLSSVSRERERDSVQRVTSVRTRPFLFPRSLTYTLLANSNLSYPKTLSTLTVTIMYFL